MAVRAMPLWLLLLAWALLLYPPGTAIWRQVRRHQAERGIQRALLHMHWDLQHMQRPLSRGQTLLQTTTNRMSFLSAEAGEAGDLRWAPLQRITYRIEPCKNRYDLVRESRPPAGPGIEVTRWKHISFLGVTSSASASFGNTAGTQRVIITLAGRMSTNSIGINL